MSRRVTLFGGLEVHRDGTRVQLDSTRVESLLAYLALHRDAPVPRSTLAFRLWPDTTGSQARTNLRKVLHLLRRAFPDGDDLLTLTRATIGWRADSGWGLDVADFDAHVAAGRYEDATGVYRGDLVPSCQDEWLEPVRSRYRDAHVDVLRRAAADHVKAGDLDAAAGTAERVLRLEPTDEATGQLLIGLYDARGERARALRVYHGLATALRDELDVDPGPATERTRDALLSAAADGHEPAPGPARPPFVGRSTERRRLVDAFRAAESGWSSAAVVAGEAGMGKSRLVEDFGRWCAGQRAAVTSASGYAAERVLAYGPVVEWLRSAAGRRRVGQLPEGHLSELSRLLPELTRLPGLPSPEPLPEAERRRRLWNAVGAALVGRREPLVLILDDAQWADEESLGLLHHVLRTADDAPLLVVLTLRTDLREDADRVAEHLLSGLRALDRLVEVPLPPLSAQETALLAGRYPAVGSPDAGRRLWELTGGNPLFVIEALQAGWRPDAADPASSVTPRVQQVIEDHMQRLSPAARELMHVAAVVGREFDTDLVATVAGADVAVRALDELWRLGLIRERGDAAYDFAHDQIRLVAYDSASPAIRRSLHRRVARALAAAPGGPGSSAARIAHHLDRAGEADEAVPWYARAAADAQRLSGPHEAVRALERAHVLLLRLPESVERHRRELALLTALPAPLASIEGYASERISAVQGRALEVSRLAGAEPGAPLLWSLAFTALVCEDFPAARGYAQQLHDRGVQDGSAPLVAEGACLLGIAAFWQADLVTAGEWFERALRSARPEDTVHHLATYGQDPRTVALARLGNVRALLGDPAGARAACDEALAAADALGHPLSRSAAYVFAALLGLDLEDDGLVRRCVSAVRESACDARPIRYAGRALAGHVDVLDGDTDTGLAAIAEVIDEASSAPAAPGMAAILLRVRLAAAVASGDEVLAVDTARRLRDDAGPGRLWRGVAEHVLSR